jgi:hypothetical protein
LEATLDIRGVLPGLLAMLREACLSSSMSVLLELLEHVDQLLLHLQRGSQLEVEDLFKGFRRSNR